MNKTKIEWCDYTINPVKGLCPMACSYCYARRMYKRFKWNPEIRFDFTAYDGVSALRKPSRIFVGSTMELFGDWVKEDWLDRILGQASLIYPQHTFIFLTKQPQNLIKWSPFPDNCWVGVSTTGFDCRSGLEDTFHNIQAKVKFVSIEPLLDYSPMDFRWVDWVIVGQQTPPSSKSTPNPEWVADIVYATNKAKIPVFIKEPMASLFNIQRKEFPNEDNS